MAEIAGVPEAALRAFSQRRAQVLDYLERRGSSGFYAAKVAALQTRDRKEPLDLPRLRLEWEARAAEHGLGRRELKRLLDRTLARELDERDVAEVTARLAGPDGLTGKRSTFSGTEAVMAWAQAHTQGAPAERVLSLVERFLAMEQVAPIAPAAVGRPAVFSTAELLRHERAALGLAARGRAGSRPGRLGGDGRAGRPRARADARPRAGGDAASRRLEPGSRRLRRRPRRRRQDDRARRARRRLPARRLRRRSAPPPPGSPPPISPPRPASPAAPSTGSSPRHGSGAVSRGGCLLVVDEAGMADTRTLTHVLFQVEHAEGKAVLVGDPAQLPAVGPGGLYARDRRAQRRDRAPRQPPPARRARTPRARPPPRRRAAATTSPTPPSRAG